MCLGAERQDDHPNTFAPEGASRCRALTSGLKGPVGGSKRTSFRESRGVKPLERQKVKEKSSDAALARSCNPMITCIFRSHVSVWRARPIFYMPHLYAPYLPPSRLLVTPSCLSSPDAAFSDRSPEPPRRSACRHLDVLHENL